MPGENGGGVVASGDFRLYGDRPLVDRLRRRVVTQLVLVQRHRVHEMTRGERALAVGLLVDRQGFLVQRRGLFLAAAELQDVSKIDPRICNGNVAARELRFADRKPPSRGGLGFLELVLFAVKIGQPGKCDRYIQVVFAQHRFSDRQCLQVINLGDVVLSHAGLCEGEGVDCGGSLGVVQSHSRLHRRDDSLADRFGLIEIVGRFVRERQCAECGQRLRASLALFLFKQRNRFLVVRLGFGVLTSRRVKIAQGYV